jgi:dynein heavy chain
LSAAPEYFVPPDGDHSSYMSYINTLPAVDPPAAFGQHGNADISSMIRETRSLLGTLVSLQPAVSGAAAGAVSSEDKVLALAADMLARLPPVIDEELTASRLGDDPNPLNVVLLQEIGRYNALLRVIRSSLTDLQKGIRGLVVMSSDLETTFQCMFTGQLPPMWSGVYPSMKPLAAWMRDLVDRVAMFAEWALTARPPAIFDIAFFTFPTGFLTAVLQNAARNNSVSIDLLSWEFPVMTVDDVNLGEQPQDGVYVRGLFLEGAGWDRKQGCLVEANAMELVSAMPTVHFKPVEAKKTARKGYYQCPCYYFPNRAGVGGASAWSFVICVELKSGAQSPDHWVKRGTALLMSLEA